MQDSGIQTGTLSPQAEFQDLLASPFIKGQSAEQLRLLALQLTQEADKVQTVGATPATSVAASSGTKRLGQEIQDLDPDAAECAASVNTGGDTQMQQDEHMEDTASVCPYQTGAEQRQCASEPATAAEDPVDAVDVDSSAGIPAAGIPNRERSPRRAASEPAAASSSQERLGAEHYAKIAETLGKQKIPAPKNKSKVSTKAGDSKSSG